MDTVNDQIESANSLLDKYNDKVAKAKGGIEKVQAGLASGSGLITTGLTVGHQFYGLGKQLAQDAEDAMDTVNDAVNGATDTSAAAQTLAEVGGNAIEMTDMSAVGASVGADTALDAGVGATEAAAAVLDSTGIGAVVGVPLAIAGAIGGLIGSIAESFHHPHLAEPKIPTPTIQAGVSS